MVSIILTALLLTSTSVLNVSAEFLMGGHLGNKNVKVTDDSSASSRLIIARTAKDDDLDLIAEESASSIASTPYPDQDPRYKIPYAFAFNGGKPFSLEKDPITGKIDFEKTPPLKALNLTDTYQADEDSNIQVDGKTKINEQYPYGKIGYLDSKRVVSSNSKNEWVGPNEINPYSPSFHDFLNLPVRYSSDKYERDNYPLISSSYANTKVQSGSNSYNINNHRPYHQETATKVSISTATRKVYYPKSSSTITSTSTITTTTTRPKTTSTAITTTSTTSRPVEEKTSTMKPTKPPTTVSNIVKSTTTTTTTTRSPVTQPKVTTWKPTKNTNHYDEYEDVLPIERLQNMKNGTPQKYGHYSTTKKDLNGHNNGPQSPSRLPSQSTYIYNDDYEDYESSPDEHVNQHHLFSHFDEIVHSVELEKPLAMLNTTTTTTTPTTPTTIPSTITTTSTFVTSPSLNKLQPSMNIHLTTYKPSMVSIYQQPPVTSMPLDMGNNPIHIPPVHENFVENHKPIESFNNNNNNNIIHSSIHFTGNTYSRPGSVINVLPESTSNVIVPHDQDTISFVLGNKQNVEGSYYTLGTAVEEHPYVPNSNENNFRPIFGSGSNVQQPIIDQKVSVALPSVAVLEPSSSPDYNSPSKWYNPSAAQSSVISDIEIYKKPQSSFIFSSMLTNDKNNNSNDTSQKEKIPVSGYVAFSDINQDKQHEQNKNPIQRPVEEHIIVINQADGSIKEITPNNLNNQAKNSVILSSNNANNNYGNNNNQILPQLSENLTPPAESRLTRPSGALGGINQRPPHYFHYQHGNINSGKPMEYLSRPQRIPLPPRQKPELPSVGFKRRTSTSHDVKLPNILPQFRPNAKTSHGHKGADKIGTLTAPQSYPNRPRPSSPQSVTHLHPSRRPQSYPTVHLQRLSPPPLPSSIHQHSGSRRKEETTASLPLSKPEHLKRYHPSLMNARPAAQKLRMEDEASGERFSAEPPQMPPRPIIFPKNRSDGQVPKVATLQMIQQRGALDEDMIRSNLPPLFKINRSDETKDDVPEKKNLVLMTEADGQKDNNKPESQEVSGASDIGPVYVVYPVNSAVNIGSQEDNVERDESVVIGTRGPHRPLPPDTLLHDDQAGDQEKPDEDKLNEFFYEKRQQHHNAINTDFLSQNYPADRPDSSVLIREKPLLIPSDDIDEDNQASIKPEKITAGANIDINESGSTSSTFNVISYLQDFLPFSVKKQHPATISATLPRLPTIQASSPIAFVYTPTTPSAFHRYQELQLDEDVTEPEGGQLYERNRDEKPVLLPSQQPSSSSSSAPSPQSFMAPFMASLSAEMPARNGWSVVVTNRTERPTATRPNEIEAKDSRGQIAAESANPEVESQTEVADDSFDPESFKPQLFGGFKPIYEFPVDEDEHTPMVGRGLASDFRGNVSSDQAL